MIRKPVVAGQFYPGEKNGLSSSVDDFLNAIQSLQIPGQILGIMVPHAGYIYSGPTAAYAYKAVAQYDIETVILLGPTHRVFLKEFAVYGKGAWQTPLGTVPINEQLAQKITNYSTKIQNMPEAHNLEHSLEVQIPFLQRIFKDIKIVPIMMLEPSYADCQMLASAIAENIKDKKVLLLASSDLYHGDHYSECRKTDSITLSYIENFDPEGLYNALKADKASACGGHPIVVLMLACQMLGASQSAVLHRTNSNDVIGEKGGYVVGYAASVFYKNEKTVQTKTEPANTDTIILTTQEEQELIRIARTTLNDYITSGTTPKFQALTLQLNEQYGVFVTLKKKGELRGCIGYVQGFKPLYQAVVDMAIAASTEDPRFPKVKQNELKDIDIEITVMTPLKQISSIDEIIVGKHGLVIKKGGYSGLLLPQVATEQGWDKKTFLQHTCWKAGLPDNAWQDKETEIYIFSGTIIQEE
ncbi:MAG: AmmeMemoRadiSam system protein B [Candidatus Latescibacteria bacterium]|nr:AmmeMemoRadiSam system protein B [Candidatus Latescibacterota bacterium]